MPVRHQGFFPLFFCSFNIPAGQCDLFLIRLGRRVPDQFSVITTPVITRPSFSAMTDVVNCFGTHGTRVNDVHQQIVEIAAIGSGEIRRDCFYLRRKVCGQVAQDFANSAAPLLRSACARLFGGQILSPFCDRRQTGFRCLLHHTPIWLRAPF
jgi:hypothetical protein